MKKNHFVGCRISPGDCDQIQKICAELHINQSEFFRRQIRAGLDQRDLQLALHNVLKIFGRQLRSAIKSDVESLLNEFELEVSTQPGKHND